MNMKITFYIVCLALFDLAANVLADYYELTQPLSQLVVVGMEQISKSSVQLNYENKTSHHCLLCDNARYDSFRSYD